MYFFPAPRNIDHVNDFHHAAAVHFAMNALRATGSQVRSSYHSKWRCITMARRYWTPSDALSPDEIP
jgi:hypothetical protein